MANEQQFRDAVVKRAIEDIRVASFEHPKAGSHTEWSRRLEDILTRFIEDWR